jgi:anti-repressor protein
MFKSQQKTIDKTFPGDYNMLTSKQKQQKRGETMNTLKIFSNSEFGDIRTMMIDDTPYFVGKNVADILGYTNTQKAIRDHVDDEDKLTERIVLSGQNRDVIFINESGLYSLILSSKLPTAKKFKHWITSEVLPSIRKNGGYIDGQETLTDEELLAKALLVAQNKIAERDAIIEKQQARIEKDKPKTIFADAVSASHTSILIGDLAKLIAQNGVQIGQKRLFQWLRDNGYLIKSGTSKNMPTQRYVEQGLFEIKESNVQNPDGSVRITRTTKVSGAGQIYFINKFLKGGVGVE